MMFESEKTSAQISLETEPELSPAELDRLAAEASAALEQAAAKIFGS